MRSPCTATKSSPHLPQLEKNGSKEGPVQPKIIFKKCLKEMQDFPQWISDKESTCQCRIRGFNPWSGKMPRAAEQLGLHATTMSFCPRAQKPQLLSPCATTMEACMPYSPQPEKPPEGEVCAPLATTTEKPVHQPRPSTVKNDKVIEKKGNANLKHDVKKAILKRQK